MSDASVELRRPSAAVSWPFGEVSADTVTVEVAVNRNARVSFSAFTGEEASEKANRVLSGEAAALMGEAQVQAHSRRDSPDCAVTLQDGNGQRLTLEGFMVGPAYALNRGVINPTFNFVAETAALANLKLDIYTAVPPPQGADVIQIGATSPNLAGRLRELTEMAIQHWEEYKPLELAGKSLEIAEQRHSINLAGPLQHWYALLDNSVESLETEWLPEMAKNTGFNGRFNGELLDVLRGASRDFLDVVAALMGSFQLMMVPGKDGGPGKLIPLADTVALKAETLVLSAASLVLNGAGGSDLLPVQQVLMRGVSEPAVDVSTKKGGGAMIAGGYVVGGFPEEAASASGEVVIETLPFYLDRMIEWQGEVTKRPGGGAPSHTKLAKRFSQLVKTGLQYQNAMVHKLVTAHCRNAYVNYALGGNGATVQLPADVSLWPGKRYNVVNAAGEPLFTGFLGGLSHTFSKSGGGGNASTSLNFSHILFPGFTLPGF